MGIFDFFKRKKPVKVDKPKEPRAPVKSEKELATERGEPFVTIVSMQVDPNSMQSGAIELDWNDKFISNLIRAGYQMSPKDTDADIVDRWFTAVCRNIVMETYEQYEAMNPERDRVIKTRDMGDGRSEVS